jgi:hypothetical protein
MIFHDALVAFLVQRPEYQVKATPFRFVSHPSLKNSGTVGVGGSHPNCNAAAHRVHLRPGSLGHVLTVIPGNLLLAFAVWFVVGLNAQAAALSDQGRSPLKAQPRMLVVGSEQD